LQQPMTVGQPNEQLCFYGTARGLTIGALKGPAKQTTMTGFARQLPVAVYQTPCQRPKRSGPVQIRLDDTAAAAQTGAYTILLAVPVPYAVLNQQLAGKLYHQTVKAPTLFGGTLLIERVTASDVNGRTLIAVATSGNVNGTLYYWGTPQLAQQGTVLSIPDLQMANETKMELDEVSTGYWKVVDEALRDRLRQAAQIDLSPRLASVKEALSGQHKSGDVAMDVLIARQEAGPVSSNSDGLVADILLEGTASAAARVPLTQEPSQGLAPHEATDERALAAPAPSRSARLPEGEELDELSGPRERLLVP